MKRYQKLIVLIVISLSVILIYKKENKNTKTYLVLGDSLALGINSYGAVTYGYDKYLKDYLEENDKINIINNYTSKNKDIKSLKNDILENSTYVIDNNSYNIRKLLKESEIITLSIGINDIIYEYNITNKDKLTEYEENRIVDYIYENFTDLLEDIRKYTNKPIYIVGYPENNEKYKRIIGKLNKKYENIGKGYIFINTSEELNNNKYFDIENAIYPNTLGYKKISDLIIKKYKLHVINQ